MTLSLELTLVMDFKVDSSSKCNQFRSVITFEPKVVKETAQRSLPVALTPIAFADSNPGS